MRQWLRFSLLLLPLVLSSGCVTHQLWTESALDDWNRPAPNANLRLFDASSQKDFLVVYDEYSYRHGVQKTRAYFLNQNESRIQKNKIPQFANVNLADQFPAVPVFYHSSLLETNQCTGLFVIAETNGPSFTIYSGQNELGSHQLPIYNDGEGIYKRIALTPVTVTMDATLVSGVVACLYAIGLCEGDSWPITH